MTIMALTQWRTFQTEQSVLALPTRKGGLFQLEKVTEVSHS